MAPWRGHILVPRSGPIFHIARSKSAFRYARVQHATRGRVNSKALDPRIKNVGRASCKLSQAKGSLGCCAHSPAMFFGREELRSYRGPERDPRESETCKLFKSRHFAYFPSTCFNNLVGESCNSIEIPKEIRENRRHANFLKTKCFAYFPSTCLNNLVGESCNSIEIPKDIRENRRHAHF